jgi:hypothetical protein
MALLVLLSWGMSIFTFLRNDLVAGLLCLGFGVAIAFGIYIGEQSLRRRKADLATAEDAYIATVLNQTGGH